MLFFLNNTESANLRGRYLVSLDSFSHLKTASDLAVRIYIESSFYHLGAGAEESPNLCISYILRDGEMVEKRSLDLLVNFLVSHVLLSYLLI